MAVICSLKEKKNLSAVEEQYSLSCPHTLCSFSLSQGKAESRHSLSSAAGLGCCCPLLLQLMESTYLPWLWLNDITFLSSSACVLMASQSLVQVPHPATIHSSWQSGWLRDTLVMSSVAIIDQCQITGVGNRTLFHPSLWTLRS